MIIDEKRSVVGDNQDAGWGTKKSKNTSLILTKPDWDGVGESSRIFSDYFTSALPKSDSFSLRMNIRRTSARGYQQYLRKGS
ncbi:hypothetical protein, partial [Methanocalculus sp.]|uniref:hypothetical protein n=1 Tax=Methanocalculus sp. TaxID=2004547 RepID=UPI0025ED161D